jgi:hypothetical protein
VGLQEELSRLFSRQEITEQWIARGNVSRIQASSINIDPGSNPKDLGMEAAHSIEREMKK